MTEQTIRNRYFELLQAHVARPAEEHLAAIADLGRALVLADIPPEDIGEIHEEALLRLAQESPHLTLLEAALSTSAAMTEILMAYGLAFRARNAQLQREIAEHERAEETLRESEERFRTLFEGVPIGLYRTTPGGQILDANPAMVEMLGYPDREALLAVNATDLYVDSEDRRREQVLLEREGVVREFEMQLRQRDGTVIWVKDTVRAVRDVEGRVLYYEGGLEDITERKRAEEELRNAYKRLQDIIEFLPDATFVINMDKKVIAWNRAMEEMTGVHKEEIMGKGDYAYTLPFYGIRRPMLIDLVLASDKEIEARYDYIERKGNTLIAEAFLPLMYEEKGGYFWGTAAPLLNGKGNIVGAIESIRDITERKRAEEKLQQSHEKLQRALEGTVHTLVSAIKIRDPYTGDHQRRVTRLACAIAKEMGLPQDQIEGLRMATLIHDLGKIDVPAEVLSRPGPLSDLQYGLIKMHSQTGYDVLKTVDFPWPVAEIVLQHHERLDGSGYPQGLSGEEIILEARILAVADVVEAMASNRPYRAALGLDKALEEISQNRGILYDPEVVDVCLRLFTEKGFTFK